MSKEPRYEIKIEEYRKPLFKRNYRLETHSHDCRNCIHLKVKLTNPYWYKNPNTQKYFYIQPNIRFTCSSEGFEKIIKTIHRVKCKRFINKKQEMLT